MKHFYFTALLCLFSTCLFAQNKDCKFVKLKNAKGQTINCIIITGGISKLTLFKAEGKLGGTVGMRDFFSITAETKNMLPLRIDSVQFVFADNSTITLKTIGMGNVKNSSAALKPMFDMVSFGFMVENPGIEKAFAKSALRAYRVFAEKDAQFGDVFNEKQQVQYLQAISCLESQSL